MFTQDWDSGSHEFWLDSGTLGSFLFFFIMLLSTVSKICFSHILLLSLPLFSPYFFLIV